MSTPPTNPHDRDWDAGILAGAFCDIEDAVNDLATRIGEATDEDGNDEAIYALEGIAIHCRQIQNHIDGLTVNVVSA